MKSMLLLSLLLLSLLLLQATMYYRNHHLLININFDHYHVLNFNPVTTVSYLGMDGSGWIVLIQHRIL